MKNLVIGTLLMVALVGGGVIGHYLIKPESGAIPAVPPTVPKDKDTQNLAIKNSLFVPPPVAEMNTALNENEMATAKEREISNLKASMEQTKIDYENSINNEKSARLKAEQELNDLKQTLAKKITEPSLPEPEMKPKKLNPMAQVVKTQIEKRLKERMKKLNDKAYLSLYQQEEINRLIEAQAERMSELMQQMLSEEGISEESNKEMEELNTQDEKKLQEILTQQQCSVYKELLEEEAKEQIAQTIKQYMNGMVGMKGITESLSLSDEQKQQVQGMFEERFKSIENLHRQTNNSGFPFDDKELVEKIKVILTPEQYPKLDEYLKQQEEFKKMAKAFMPKKKTIAPTEPVISPTITTTVPISK
jgi:hypothetical protein